MAEPQPKKIRNRIINRKVRKERKKNPRRSQNVGAYRDTPGGGGVAVPGVEMKGDMCVVGTGRDLSLRRSACDKICARRANYHVLQGKERKKIRESIL